MFFESAQISLVGDRRDNQDRAEILVSDESVLIVVADGMGGHPHGDLAAETAVASLSSSFRRSRGRLVDATRFLQEAFVAAHNEVLGLARSASPEGRPGTTAVCALILGEELWWTSVGDSRAYHLRGGSVLERSTDHTIVDSLLAAGAITRDQALLHPDRHIVEYCLGIDRTPPPVDVEGPRDIAVDDLVLLCSDGLWSQIGEALMVECVRQPGDLEEVARSLAEDAVSAARPQSDNVTVALLRAVPDEESVA